EPRSRRAPGGRARTRGRPPRRRPPGHGRASYRSHTRIAREPTSFTRTIREMARMFILEPEPELRELLARVVARLGHEPHEFVEASAAEIRAGDILIVAPGDEPSFEAAADVHT